MTTSAGTSRSSLSCPDLTVVGHVTHDVLPSGGTVPGGSAFYACATAHALGCSPTLLTSLGPHFAHRDALLGWGVRDLPAPETTTFVNRYRDGVRVQTVTGVARTLDGGALPEGLHEASNVLLVPVADEVPIDLVEAFPRARIAIGVQGWVRRIDAHGRVHPKRWEGMEPWLHRVTLAVLSDVEARGQVDLLPTLLEHVELVVLTHAAAGSTLFMRGERTRIPAWPAREVDPTGAGDVFTTAMLLRIAQGHTPEEAARFGAQAAAVIVEGRGASAAPRIGTLLGQPAVAVG